MTTRIRADYEQLAAIARAFGQQAETAQSLLDGLQRSMQPLQAGDWVGKGADRFYAEMTSTVLPAMQRVVAAMTEAAGTTTAIGRVMKQAEADSAALFRLDGAAVPSTAAPQPRAPGPMASPDGSGGSGAGGPQRPAARPKGRVVRVERQSRYRRRPPGPGAFTEVDHNRWRLEHKDPDVHIEWEDGDRKKDKLRPETLWAKGHFFARTEIDVFDSPTGGLMTVETDYWINSDAKGGKGDVIMVMRLKDH